MIHNNQPEETSTELNRNDVLLDRNIMLMTQVGKLQARCDLLSAVAFASIAGFLISLFLKWVE